MTGNANDGQHNLKIVNAKAEDNGEFQCQVGPAFNNQPIRATAKLTVLSMNQFNFIQFIQIPFVKVISFHDNIFVRIIMLLLLAII